MLVFQTSPVGVEHFHSRGQHRCWPREWKCSIRLIKFNSASVLHWFPLSTLMKPINYWPRVLGSFAVLPRRLPSAWTSCLNTLTGFVKAFLLFSPFLSFWPFLLRWFPSFSPASHPFKTPTSRPSLSFGFRLPYLSHPLLSRSQPHFRSKSPETTTAWVKRVYCFNRIFYKYLSIEISECLYNVEIRTITPLRKRSKTYWQQANGNKRDIPVEVCFNSQCFLKALFR